MYSIVSWNVCYTLAFYTPKYYISKSKLFVFFFYVAYHNASKWPPRNVVNCDFNSPPSPGKVCRNNINEFTECSKAKGYGYAKGSPCVFLKLNRVRYLKNSLCIRMEYLMKLIFSDYQLDTSSIRCGSSKCFNT